MAKWKIWIVVILAVVLMGTGAIISAVWNNLSSEWQVETNAAQFALNHSPMVQIQSHQVFTGSQAQEVFIGKDAFGAQWVTFVYGSPFQVQYAPYQGLMSQTNIDQIAKKNHITPIRTVIGYLDTTALSALHSSDAIVWEVYGTTLANKHVYAYFDAKTGALLHVSH